MYIVCVRWCRYFLNDVKVDDISLAIGLSLMK